MISTRSGYEKARLSEVRPGRRERRLVDDVNDSPVTADKDSPAADHGVAVPGDTHVSGQGLNLNHLGVDSASRHGEA